MYSETIRCRAASTAQDANFQWELSGAYRARKIVEGRAEMKVSDSGMDTELVKDFGI